MSIFEKFIGQSPDEVAGSTSTSRFDYQKNWALAELIDRHEKGQDYVVTFEFHDDVVIFDSEPFPTKASFYQVKTKKAANWTIAALCKIEKGKTRSILGKLFGHFDKFEGFVEKVSFVTNSYFSFDKKKTRITGDSLSRDERQDVTIRLQSECPSLDDQKLDSVEFLHSDLSLEDHEGHLKGKLHNFLCGQLGTADPVPVESWYQNLSIEIKIKNNRSASEIESVEDFINKKCICKSSIEKFLEVTLREREARPRWESVEIRLTQEGIDFGRLMQISTSWKRYEIERLNQSNLAVQELADAVQKRLPGADLANKNLSLIATEIANELSGLKDRVHPYISESDFEALILWEYCWYAKLQTTSQESEDKEA